jgi:hypothetical protein
MFLSVFAGVRRPTDSFFPVFDYLFRKFFEPTIAPTGFLGKNRRFAKVSGIGCVYVIAFSGSSGQASVALREHGRCAPTWSSFLQPPKVL